MAAQQDLAAGLIGAAGALFAAWLAFDAIQEQLADQRRRLADQRLQQLQQEADAKLVAVVCLTQPIHAAANALAQINKALRIKLMGPRDPAAAADALVELAIAHVRSTLDSFTIQEAVRDLGRDDKVQYLLIVGTLAAFLNISKYPSPVLTREERLISQRDILMRIHNFLGIFERDLAAVFAQDSETKPQEP